jgi:transposase
MYKVNLSQNEQLELDKLEKEYQWDWKKLRRLKCLHLRNEWVLPRVIANKLDVSHDSITDRIKLFTKGWFSLLLSLQYEWRRISEFEKYKDQILEMVESKTYDTYKDLHYDICQKHNITKKQDALWKFCKKNWIWVIRNVT